MRSIKTRYKSIKVRKFFELEDVSEGEIPREDGNEML